MKATLQYVGRRTSSSRSSSSTNRDRKMILWRSIISNSRPVATRTTTSMIDSTLTVRTGKGIRRWKTTTTSAAAAASSSYTDETNEKSNIKNNNNVPKMNFGVRNNKNLHHHQSSSSVWLPYFYLSSLPSFSQIEKGNHNVHWDSPLSSTERIVRWWTPLMTLQSSDKIPKGFEDFFPDGIQSRRKKLHRADDEGTTSTGNGSEGQQIDEEKSSDDDKKQTDSAFASKDNSKKKDDDTNKKKKDNKQKKRPPLGDNNDNDTARIPEMLALLAIIVALRSLMEQVDELTQGAEEITFTEFRNRYLLKGVVEKIIVINNKQALIEFKSDYYNNYNNTSTTTQHQPNSMESIIIDNSTNNADSLTTWSNVSTTSSATSKQQQRRSQQQQPVQYYFNIGSVEILEEKLAKAQAHVHPESWVEVQYRQNTNWALELVKLLPIVAFMAALFFGSRGMAGMSSSGGRGGAGGGGIGGIFSVGKSTHKKIKPEDVSVTFADVAGCDQAKLEIMEFVDFLKDAERFTKLGAKIPKGALLSGPPGTGKTLLAKATAGEAGVPFYSISGSDFIEMFVGVGPSRVRDLFKEARQNAPCIVFIDEIDAVGRQRGRGGFSGGGNDERENTLNQLLVEMDGFSSSTGVVVLAGTNRSDILDQALTRPGRFDRQIVVDKPDLQGRKEIFKVHLKGIKLENDVDEYAGRLAGLTPGFAGADIANVCNEAAIVAARRKAESVSMQDFEKATDRIIGGLESNKIMSPEERTIVAHHEAGHAVAGWFLEHADPLLKVTIIPRSSGALGFAQYLPKEVFLRNKEQIMDIVCMTLAGRAAEQVFFGRVTTGASDDLRRVTQIVYSMIKDYGMNARVGQLSYPSEDNQNMFGKGDRRYSDSVAEAMDDEAREIVDDAYERTINLIQEHKENVAKVAQLLMDKETITHDDIYELVGPRPFVHDTAYQEYVTSRGITTPKVDDDGDKKPSEEQGSDSAVEEDNTRSGLTPGLA